MFTSEKKKLEQPTKGEEKDLRGIGGRTMRVKIIKLKEMEEEEENEKK